MEENKTNEVNNNTGQTVYRQETLKRISSPEQLTDYLKVTGVGIWVVLITVILLLVGIFVWSALGTLETKQEAVASVKSGQAEIVLANPGKVKEGFPVRIKSDKFTIDKILTDEYGRAVLYVQMNVPDGDYKVEVVTNQIHPIEFLLTNQ